MADAAPINQMKSSSQLSSEHENPSKFFLYKAALVTVFLVLVPLLPSLAPDFFNQTLHARSWELLQLIFVGIAVSYGLFSKKNDEHTSKIDNAQSYVSKLLQVSSVFDDESENHTVIEESKFQALNSQYYRGEPVVVVAKENPAAIEEKNGVVSQITQKPLLLPVRSLKQRVDSSDDSGGISSNRFSSTSRKSRIGRLNVNKVEEEKEEENLLVLRSPIPWRSRSGRMEMKESSSDELTSFSMEEQELSRSFRSSRPNPSPSPKNLSGEDVVRKNFSPPPPAPPPPPSPSFLRKSVLIKSNSTVGNNPAGSTKKGLARSVRSVPTEELAGMDYDNDGLVKSKESSMDYDIKFFDKRMMPQKEEELAETTTDEEDDDYFPGNVEGDDTAKDAGPDVDKKADEFIAKFREQIRLQRIESIRRSTAQRAGKTSR